MIVKIKQTNKLTNKENLWGKSISWVKILKVKHTMTSNSFLFVVNYSYQYVNFANNLSHISHTICCNSELNEKFETE